jgi:transposase
LQTQVLAECAAPGASVAKVAMSHGINANVVHRWRQLARQAQPGLAPSGGEFVPVSLPATPLCANARDIQIQLRRGATAVSISWPMSAAGEFGVWLRELLR